MHNVTVDWKNRTVAGNAVAAIERGWKDSFFECPLISHIYTDKDGGELWSGGCMDDTKLDDDFDLVISLYPWEQFVLGPDTDRVEVRAYDSPNQDPTIFISLAEMAVENIVSGKKVLVHCQAGLNRSGVVSSIALIKLGYTPEEAVELMRDKRDPYVLCNESFEKFVLGYTE